MKSPLVSICCITYNHGQYIREALDGFLMQETKFPFEVLVHDDASMDNTADIIREYAAKYPNIIKPFYQTENQYSKGIEILNSYIFPYAEGKYIAICEGDDYWIDSKKLQKQVDFLEAHRDYGLVCTNYNVLHQQTNIVSERDSKFQNEKEVCSIEAMNTISTLTVLMNKKLLLDYVDELTGQSNYVPKSATDFPIWTWFIKRSKVYYLNDITSIYRICQISATNFNGEGEKALEYCFNCEKTILRLQELNLLSNNESKYLLLGLESKRWLGFFYTKKYKKTIKSFLFLLNNGRYSESLNIIKMFIKLIFNIK